MQHNPLSHLAVTDTIYALSTPAGTGAIAVIRISGPATFNILRDIFSPAKATNLTNVPSHQILLGRVLNAQGQLLDQALVSLFRSPSSYTGEDLAEISCHGSDYIQQKILELLSEKGCRLSKPGEFTMRAFLNGKLDLSQAEAVADLVAANSDSSHGLAMKQLRGGVSMKIAHLREQLVRFMSLMELELDFSQEDVEFADRAEFQSLLDEIMREIATLVESFRLGNALKKGIPVAIIGKPNVGKSTLLNALLKDEKAIVSDIPGTTRDSIEDTISMGGITFRFIDTAGLRDETTDKIEYIGIEKAYKKIEEASIILYVFDISQHTYADIKTEIEGFQRRINDADKSYVILANKADLLANIPSQFSQIIDSETLFISAKNNVNLNLITERLLNLVGQQQVATSGTLVTNTRHVEALTRAGEAIEQVFTGLQNNVPTDLLTIDVRTALHHLGEITGEVTTDEILDNIFGKFCIGK